jgi:hypothetical protein
MRPARPLALILSTALLALPGTALADGHGGETRSQGQSTRSTFAVIGDVPYGADQLAAFPGWIDQINAAKPGLTFHVGDVKNGSTRCDDAYYRLIRSDFDRFENPLVYTPGDNEWTDCHRANNGGYDPLERLAFDRSVFFDRPGRTMGQHPTKVEAQTRSGFPENVRLRREGIDFATLHVVGSNNDLQPWSGIGNTDPTPAQVAEERARMDNVLAVVHDSFATANRTHDRAVVLLLQADMFDPTYTPTPNDISAFRPLVQALVEESSHYRGHVYLVNGDSHAYNVDHPLAVGSPWLTTYGVSGAARNLTRITVDGSDNNHDWLRFTINGPRAADALSWEQVAYTG